MQTIAYYTAIPRIAQVCNKRLHSLYSNLWKRCSCVFVMLDFSLCCSMILFIRVGFLSVRLFHFKGRNLSHNMWFAFFNM